MTIVLIRHAHAIDKGSLDDESRWLTETGREVAHRAGERMRDAGIKPDLIWSSPLVRTIQTAELVVAGLRWKGTVEVLPSLAPTGSPRDAGDELRAAHESVVVAVGHEPGMSTLAALLTKQRVFGAFQKGEVLVIKDGKVVQALKPDV